jgi:hypothetical protein
MRCSTTAILLICLLGLVSSGCGPSYGYGYRGDPYGPYWGAWGGRRAFVIHHPWEDHEHGHSSDFHGFGAGGHYGGFRGGGSHGGGHGGGHGR